MMMDKVVLKQIADAIFVKIHDKELTFNSEKDLKEMIKSFDLLRFIPHTEDDISRLEHIVSPKIVIINDDGAAITSKDTKPWLKGKRETEIEWRYWDRYRKHLKYNEGFPWPVINKVGEYTRDILDSCGDPSDAHTWKRSGLVVGHVQSGKTTNYSGLMARGIDSGYKIFILFAGITNSLRAQTQERIEENIIGLSTKVDGIVGVGQFPPKLPVPTRLTSFTQDFNSQTRRAVGVDLNDEGVHIFVLKKNVKTIENLITWIKDKHPHGRVTAPMMLIDDEADNASINTSNHPNRMTKINEGIRNVLERFDRATYVGYTATPFANIFIDHEDDASLIKSSKTSEDIFPRNFIKSLGTPDNYVGAARLFGSEIEHPKPLLHTVSIVDDYQDILELAHKKTIASTLSRLPPSLENAIMTFVLFCTIQKLRGECAKHMTMMINVSRFNDVQSRVEDLVTEYLETLLQSASAGAGLGISGLQSQSLLEQFKKIYENGSFDGETPYAKTPECNGINFVDHIMPELYAVLRTIKPKTVNMLSGGLVYDKDDPQRVIAIGGLALSRGLTLEGLSVSYLLRNAAASDTLMQMARWFGYRLGYENLIRLFLPEISYNHYRAVHESIEELRQELRQMESVKKTPLQFGLKVRNSTTGIRITAANKSRSAKTISFARNLENKHIQGYLLAADEKVRLNNLQITTNFINKLGQPLPETEIKQNYAMWDVNGSEVLEFIKDFSFPDSHPDFGKGILDASFIEDYISDRLSLELKKWDVVIIKTGSSQEPPVTFLNGTLEVKLSKRYHCHSFKNDPELFKITGGDAVANPRDIETGLDHKKLEKYMAGFSDVEKSQRGFGASATARFRSKPLLLLYFIDCMQSKKSQVTTPINGFNASNKTYSSLTVLMPTTELEPIERQYTANKVLEQLGYDNENDEDDDSSAIVESGGI
jgi:hypothetical protein